MSYYPAYPTADAQAAAAYGAPTYAAAPYGGPPSASYAPQYYTAPPPAAAPAPTSSDEVRTIFISGFPADVKERELNNLLRFLPGYEASQMNWKNGQAQGFALFSTGQFARAAVDTMMQLVFDEGTILRAEMARKNMYIKGNIEDPNKRARTGAGGYTGAAPYTSSSAGTTAQYKTTTYTATGGGGGGGADNPPCNTLFVGNLCETVNEAELLALFQPHQGFQRLKIVRGRNTTAFVEYDTVANAMPVHDMQQGAVLASNTDRGGIRLQYSRNPFGKKRDATGAMVEAVTTRSSEFAGHSDPAPHGTQQPGGGVYEATVPYDPSTAARENNGSSAQ